MSTIWDAFPWRCTQNVVYTKNHFSCFSCAQENLSFYSPRFSDAQFLHATNFTTVHVCKTIKLVKSLKLVSDIVVILTRLREQNSRKIELHTALFGLLNYHLLITVTYSLSKCLISFNFRFRKYVLNPMVHAPEL